MERVIASKIAIIFTINQFPSLVLITLSPTHQPTAGGLQYDFDAGFVIAEKAFPQPKLLERAKQVMIARKAAAQQDSTSVSRAVRLISGDSQHHITIDGNKECVIVRIAIGMKSI